MSFLDCICCGFGAMLLLYVLTIGKNADLREIVVSKIQATISRLESDITREERVTGDIRERIRVQEDHIQTKSLTRETIKSDISRLTEQLTLMLQQQASLKEELERLLAEKKEIPKEEIPPPVPIPNVQRRQYLSGFNFEGKSMLFLVEASGGMLGNTVDEAISYIGKSDEEKRKSDKWRRVVRSVQWVIANLTPDQAYQVVIFNTEAKPVITDSEDTWFDPTDRANNARVLRALEDTIPSGGANFEQAFLTVREKFPVTDSIVLITDSLPTLSDSIPVTGATDDRDRERMFRAALRELPRKTPVNTILFPMSGDPAAAFLFWQLADSTGGSLISPSPSWPDT